MRRSAAVLSLVGLSACAHVAVLEPGAGVPVTPDHRDVADVEIAGVRVFAAGDAWKGNPEDLAKVFTPLQVSIENHSGKTVRISYPDFRLVGASGFQYAALPPMNARGRIDASAGAPARIEPAVWRHDRFFIAPHFAPFYPGLAPWWGPFPYDPLWYDGFYARWPEYLPTEDMLSEALPEGAVQDGGTVAGFVYFQNVTARENSVRFELTLIDANSGETLGTARIPFDRNRG